MELKAGENDNGRRLDRVLRKALPCHPLPLIHRLLRQGLVYVDGKPAKAQYRIIYGETISIPSLKSDLKPGYSASTLPYPETNVDRKRVRTCGTMARQFANNFPEIIWQGGPSQGHGLLAVNKPSGLEVHGPGSLEAIVNSFLAGKLPPSLSFKPGPLHRLDKPSSGIVVFSTNIDGARLFSALLKERKVRKTYLALLEGSIGKEEIWQDELVRDTGKKKTFISPAHCANSKTAVTIVRPLASNGDCCLVTAEIRTGRTHQIRAQAAARGCPLAGDRKYGGSKCSRDRRHGQSVFFLHAWKMDFLDYSIEAPLPAAFREKITALFDYVHEISGKNITPHSYFS